MPPSTAPSPLPIRTPRLVIAAAAALLALPGQGAETGGTLYARHCAACHGADGGGGQGASLIDAEWRQGGDPEAIASSIARGFPDQGMPGFAPLLSDAEIHALAAHVVNLHPGGGEAVIRNPLAVPGPGFPEGRVRSAVHDFRVETVAELTPSYGLASLPDGQLLVTEISGALRVIANGKLVEAPVAGTPGGTPRAGFRRQLLDVAIHPDYRRNGWIYLGAVDAGADEGIDVLTLHRGRLREGRWVDDQVLLRLDSIGAGAKIAFDADNHLYLSSPIMSQPPVSDPDFGHPRAASSQAQDLASPHGKILRLNDDGTVPEDNPFVGRQGANPYVWSLGHRAPLGIAFDASGNLWATENGPRGGDELNRILPGKNYGWPLISWGHRYDDQPASLPTAMAGLELPVLSWVPSIAPSAITLYRGDAFPRWRGNLLMGTLRPRDLYRLVLDGTEVVLSERLLRNGDRVRDLEVDAEGMVYLLTDDGKVLRLVPADL
ncbi:MAG: PQQ-dependent sugar dehydrogenase [Pseudomonadota bacterium]|nr:PQQ-dependent sugar dehydrogenase [Pseudomonadota bacterium]